MREKLRSEEVKEKSSWGSEDQGGDAEVVRSWSEERRGINSYIKGLNDNL